MAGFLDVFVRSEEDTCLPRHSEKGVIGHDEMKKLVAIGEKRGQALEAKIGTTVTPPAGACSTVVPWWVAGAIIFSQCLGWSWFAKVDHVREKLAGGKPAIGPDSDEKDVRVLSVLFDTAEERWRTVHEAVPDFEEIDYDDFPLQGPRTITHDTRQLRRLGFDFAQHHKSWVKKSGVRVSDRSVHEHSAICRCLN